MVGQATFDPALAPKYGDPAVDRRANGVDQRQPVEGRDKAKAVAAGDKDRLGVADCGARIVSGVHPGELDAVRGEPFLESGGCAVVVALGVGDHHGAPGTTEVLDDCLLADVLLPPACSRRRRGMSARSPLVRISLVGRLRG